MRNRLWGVSLLAVAVSQAAFTGAKAQSTGLSSTPSTANAHGIEEVIVTASKRSEKLQRVPMSIQVLDTKSLERLHVNDFQDYLKLLPSLTAQTLGPNQTTIYMRGIASGAEGNHSGPLPTVGSYLDELPITTIGGTLDVHVYDIARVESLPGPQGTLFGASSEAGTLRIITNQPKIGKFEVGYDLEGNVVSHGGLGGVAEGFVNIPVNDRVAIRLVGFDEHDAGYIDNVFGTRTYSYTDATIDNRALVKNRFNPADTFGGRASLKLELPDDWTLTPTAIYQDQRNSGTFFYDPKVGDLQVQRFQPDTFHDRWVQAGVTVQGKIGDFDLTYAGGFFVRDEVQKSDYSDYSVAYDPSYGQYWTGANGQPLPTPSQEIYGKDHFTKESNEIRLASPSSDRLRFIVGAFQEIQQHRILQDYEIQGLAYPAVVQGWPNTIWLTDQLRTDRDIAAFGELAYDILPQFTITGGVRPYYYENSLEGYFGYSQTQFGVACLPGRSFADAPCENLNKVVVGRGETHKINLTYRLDNDKLVYFTYSTGYRPGGVNRNILFGGYDADTLTNFELGAKTSWLDQRLHVNVAIYDEDWNKFQFSFLGPSSLTIISNANGANVKGAEAEVDFRPIDRLTLSGGATVTDAALSSDLCAIAGQTVCTGSGVWAPNGTRLPYVSRFKGNMTGRYTFDAFGWDANVQATLAYQTSADTELLTNKGGLNYKALLGQLPGYPTLDMSAGIEKNKLSLSLFVKNATDERGQENRQVACTIGVCTRVYILPIQPLTVGLRLAQRF